MKISIIIPVYNVELYIADCLHSVMNQTMTEGVECILVDDCGQDNSILIAEQMISEYNGDIQFSVFHNEHNKGLSGARNAGILAAKGDYLYFLDSDDWVEPFCLEKLCDTLARYPESQMVFAGLRMTKNTIPHIDFEIANLPDYSNNPNWIQTAMLSYNLNVSSWNKLVNREFVLNNNLFFAEGYIYEDDIWNFEISKFLTKISICHCNTYIYRVRENSIMTTSSLCKTFLNKTRLIEYKANAINGHHVILQTKNIWMTLLDLYNKKVDVPELIVLRDKAANMLQARSKGIIHLLILLSIKLSWMSDKCRLYNYFFYKFASIKNSEPVII